MQLMAFMPELPVKDYQNIGMFDDDVVRYPDRCVMTLRDGFLFGDRLECKVRTNRGKLHGQQPQVHIPGVGLVQVRICASDIVLVPGMHKIPIHTRAVLPWGRKPTEQKHFVPDTIHQVTFDFPAILLAAEKSSKGALKTVGDPEPEEDGPDEGDGDSPKKKKKGWFGGGSTDKKKKKKQTAPATTPGGDDDPMKKHGEYYERNVYTQRFKIDPFMLSAGDLEDPDAVKEEEPTAVESSLLACNCLAGGGVDDDEEDQPSSDEEDSDDEEAEEAPVEGESEEDAEKRKKEQEAKAAAKKAKKEAKKKKKTKKKKKKTKLSEEEIEELKKQKKIERIKREAEKSKAYLESDAGTDGVQG